MHMTNRRTLKQYEAGERVRTLRMNAARKRAAAERHEAIAARFRADALELDAERARLTDQLAS
jgi:hypothetical protein